MPQEILLIRRQYIEYSFSLCVCIIRYIPYVSVLYGIYLMCGIIPYVSVLYGIYLMCLYYHRVGRLYK